MVAPLDTSTAPAILFSEDFETDGNGTRYTTSTPEFSDGIGDFFTRTDGSNIASFYEVSGFVGSFYFAGMDLDGEGAAASQTITFSDIDITGATHLSFSGLFAEDDDSDNQDWDADSSVRVLASIDGGAFEELLRFEAAGGTNTEPRLDTNGDGLGDGTALTATFEEFTAGITGTGSTLSLRIELDVLDAGDEDVAFDNLRITGLRESAPMQPVINEVLFDPAGDLTGDANGDGVRSASGDEFIEIVNPGSTDLDIGGWTLSDDDTTARFTFPAGTILPAGGAAVLFGGGTPTGDFGGALVFVDDGTIGTGLGNSGDLIELRDAQGTLVDSFAYGGAGDITGGSDQSITRDPDAAGAFSDHGVAAGSGGALFSPGTKVDGTPFGGPPPEATIAINELRVNQSGADTDEFFELFASGPGASLAGLSLIGISSEFAPGQIDFAFDLSAGSFDADGIFMIARDSLTTGSFDPGDLTIPADLNLFGSPTTYLLVEGFTGAPGDDLDTDDDGVLDSMPWTRILDSVALIDGDSTPDRIYSDSVVGPDGDFAPAGAAAIPDGSDTFQQLAFGDLLRDTPGALNDPDLPFTDRKIHEIQGATDLADGTLVGVAGAADESPLLGEAVRIEGIVTKYLPDLGGFYVQEEDADADADEFTSEGIFVQSSFVPAGADGTQKVQVIGTVAEVGGETTLIASDVTLTGTGDAFSEVSATTVTFPTATVLLDADGDFVANLEAYEGMYVTVPTQMTVTELFQLDRFGTIKVSSDGRLEQFTQSNAPDAAGYTQHLKDIAARTLTLDDGTNAQNPDPILVPGLGADGQLDGGDVFRMGDSYTQLTGVLSYSEDNTSSEEPEYRMHTPTGTLSQDNPRPTGPVEVGSAYNVASLNVLNFFTTLDEFPNVGEGSGPGGLSPRGADANPQAAQGTPDPLDEYNRQKDKLIEQILLLDADVIGLVELENDFAAGGDAPVGTGTVIGTGVPIQELVDGINASLGAPLFDWVRPAGQTTTTPEFVGSDAIAVGFIYNTATTELVGSSAVLDTVAFTDPNGTGEGKNRAALAQTFKEIETGGEFTAAVNHFKSKGASGLSAGDAANPDSDQGDGAGFWNDTRDRAAQELARWLATNPTGSDDSDILILGDLNAYQEEDPIRTLEAAGYTDLAEAFIPDPYSFVFDGQIGTLDYALASQSLAAQVSGVAEVHLNADEPDAFDYNLEFNRNPALFTADAFRASDHDPVVIGLTLESDVEFNVILGDANRVNILLGTEGQDSIIGGDRTDLIYADDGDDIIQSGGDRDLVVAGDGDDTVEAGSGRDTVIGGKGDDEIHGNDGRDVLLGRLGDDFMDGGEGRDQIEGGQGNDTLLGGEDRDRIFAEDGDDEIDGGAGRDQLFAGEGEDFVFAGDDDDIIGLAKGKAGADGDADILAVDEDDGRDVVFGFESGLDAVLLTEGTDYELTTRGIGSTVLTYGDTEIVFRNAIVTDDDMIFV